MSRTSFIAALVAVAAGLLPAVSWAGGMHAGVPVTGVQGLGEPSFVSPSAGWTAPLTEGGGLARIFVGPSQDAAITWYNQQLQRGVTMPQALAPVAGPLPAGMDRAHGDGAGLWLFRDGNIAVMVQSASGTGARDLGEQIHAAVVHAGPAWPAAPRLQPDGPGRLVVQSDAPIAHVQFVGGALLPSAPTAWIFSAPPTGMVVWDSLGRPASWGDWQE